MISIKHYIERSGKELFQAALAAYRASLDAMGASGVQACPPVGSALRHNLLQLQAALSADAAPELLQETERKVEAELAQWGSGAADYYKQRTGEVKELMLILARTADLTGERDQRYISNFQRFTSRLEAIADIHDLAILRDSLVKSAIDLKVCAAAMAEESRKAVEQLREDVTVYQARLDDAERQACQDPLTGLDNRRRVESSIEYRIRQGHPFTVIMLDLNGFKQLNDTCGHLAGDDLLRQFAAELKSTFRVTDIVGRWGGDEFIVVLEGGLQDAGKQTDRISRWVFGEYTIRVGESARKVPVTGAIGTAEWNNGDSLRSLLDRADAAMYKNKRAGVRAPPAGG